MNCDEFNQTQDRFCVSHEKIDIFLHFCICFWCVCGVNLSEPAVSSLTKRQREYCDVNCDSFHHLFPPLKSHNFSLKRFELVVVVQNNPNFFLYFNSNSMTAQKTANIMLCLFVICLFLYSHPLVLTGVIIVVVQFSVELGRFHESRFHHLHLLRLQLLLRAVKLRLDPNQLEGDVCHFKRFLLNNKLFWLWRACSCVPAGLWGPSPGGVSPTSPSPAAAKLTHWCFSRQPVLPTSLQSGINHRRRDGRKGAGTEHLGQTEKKKINSTARGEWRPTLLSSRSVLSLNSFRSFSTLSSFSLCCWISS